MVVIASARKLILGRARVAIDAMIAGLGSQARPPVLHITKW
jgi:hypothetical protein